MDADARRRAIRRILKEWEGEDLVDRLAQFIEDAIADARDHAAFEQWRRRKA